VSLIIEEDITKENKNIEEVEGNVKDHASHVIDQDKEEVETTSIVTENAAIQINAKEEEKNNETKIMIQL
jgi:hypothetical protein